MAAAKDVTVHASWQRRVLMLGVCYVSGKKGSDFVSQLIKSLLFTQLRRSDARCFMVVLVVCAAAAAAAVNAGVKTAAAVNAGVKTAVVPLCRSYTTITITAMTSL